MHPHPSLQCLNLQTVTATTFTLLSTVSQPCTYIPTPIRDICTPHHQIAYSQFVHDLGRNTSSLKPERRNTNSSPPQPCRYQTEPINREHLSISVHPDHQNSIHSEGGESPLPRDITGPHKLAASRSERYLPLQPWTVMLSCNPQQALQKHHTHPQASAHAQPTTSQEPSGSCCH